MSGTVPPKFSRSPFQFRPKGWLSIGIGSALIAAVTTVVLIADNRDKRLIERAEEIGGAAGTIEDQNQSLDQLGDAFDAETTLNGAGERSFARCSHCLQDSRRKSACECYRPTKE